MIENQNSQLRTILTTGAKSKGPNIPIENAFTLIDLIALQNTNDIPHMSTDAKRVRLFLEKSGVDVSNPQSFLEKPSDIQEQIKRGIIRIIKRNGR